MTKRIKGTLIPIGGNEDKGNEDDFNRVDYIQEGILAHVVRESGGTDARIVVVTAASSVPKEVGKNYLSAFDTLGCKNVDVIHIKKREKTDKEKHLELIRNADCVMFSGGNQSKITAKISGTEFHRILLDRYHNENFVIAGTSAGAMAMAKEMIAGGSSTQSFIKGAVNMGEGLNLIPELIIDTHFIQRGRFGRQSEAVAKFPDLLGIGIAEDTGLIIKNGEEFQVIGSAMVLVFDPKNLTHNNEKILKQGTPMTMTNLTVHVLSNGDRFNLKTRKAEALPMSSSFV